MLDTVADLAAALDVDVAEIEIAVAEQRQAGWLAARAGGGGDVLVDGARIWLTLDGPERPKPDEVEAIASSFLAAQAAALSGTQRDNRSPCSGYPGTRTRYSPRYAPERGPGWIPRQPASRWRSGR